MSIHMYIRVCTYIYAYTHVYTCITMYNHVYTRFRCTWGALGCLLDPLGTLLGSFLASFGRSWGLSGAPWRHGSKYPKQPITFDPILEPKFIQKSIKMEIKNDVFSDTLFSTIFKDFYRCVTPKIDVFLQIFGLEAKMSIS